MSRKETYQKDQLQRLPSDVFAMIPVRLVATMPQPHGRHFLPLREREKEGGPLAPLERLERVPVGKRSPELGARIMRVYPVHAPAPTESRETSQSVEVDDVPAWC